MKPADAAWQKQRVKAAGECCRRQKLQADAVPDKGEG